MDRPEIDPETTVRNTGQFQELLARLGTLEACNSLLELIVSTFNCSCVHPVTCSNVVDCWLSRDAARFTNPVGKLTGVNSLKLEFHSWAAEQDGVAKSPAVALECLKGLRCVSLCCDGQQCELPHTLLLQLFGVLRLNRHVTVPKL